MVHIFPLVINKDSAQFTFKPHFCQNVMFFHQNIDGNMKFRNSFIIIDLQIDEKHHIVTENEV